MEEVFAKDDDEGTAHGALRDRNGNHLSATVKLTEPTTLISLSVTVEVMSVATMMPFARVLRMGLPQKDEEWERWVFRLVWGGLRTRDLLERGEETLQIQEHKSDSVFEACTINEMGTRLCSMTRSSYHFRSRFDCPLEWSPCAADLGVASEADSAVETRVATE